MIDLVRLAENLRRAQNSYQLLESRDRQLNDLVRTDRWKDIYDEVTFRRICNENQKELAVGLGHVTKAEEELRSAALIQTSDIGRARQLIRQAQKQAQSSHDKKFADFLNREESPAADLARGGERCADGRASPPAVRQNPSETSIERAIAAWEQVEDRNMYPLPGPDGRPIDPIELVRAEDAMLAEMEKPD